MSKKASSYSLKAISHLKKIERANRKTVQEISKRLVKNVKAGKSLFVFGSGHSAIFPMELYHRAGGASFVIPMIADFLLPTAGPSAVRVLERTPGIANFLLDRYGIKKGEMLWMTSQSGINPSSVDLAIEARARGIYVVAFTSLVHSRAVGSRHPKGLKLYQVADQVVDLGGKPGDALVAGPSGLQLGPVSTLGSVFLGHSILVQACLSLEKSGVRCVYTSVNTPEGEKRNRAIEEKAKLRDFLLR